MNTPAGRERKGGLTETVFAFVPEFVTRQYAKLDYCSCYTKAVSMDVRVFSLIMRIWHEKNIYHQT